MLRNSPFSTILTIILFLFVVSCNKDQTCRAQIIVVDINGIAVSGATVKLYIPASTGLTNTNVESIKTTNANGLAEFAYKDPVILNIKATTISPKKINDTTDIIKLDRSKTVQKTVIIN
jgi:hypothetical protein